MDEAIESVFAEYEKRSAAEFKLRDVMTEREWLSHRDELLISVGPRTGQILNILIKGAKARNILELGTSYGYSSVWLGEAARATGGKVISLDDKSEKQEYARGMIAKAGLTEYVEYRLGDARETIASLPGPFDFVLIDLWKDLYIPCFDLVYPKLSRGAYVAADNMIQPQAYREHANEYRRHARSKPHIDSVLLTIGSGVELSRYGDPLTA